MNHKIVLFTLGRVVLIEAALLVLPMAVSLLYGERCALSFALTIVLAAAIGSLLCLLCRGGRGTSSIKDGFMIVALAWIVGLLLILQGAGSILWACFTGRFWR